ncbi:MAG: YciI family protein [Pseudomonadota bacterium]
MKDMLLNYVKSLPDSTSDAIAKSNNGELRCVYTKALIDASVLVGGEALYPSHLATTIRAASGVQEIHDGLYADTKEQFGGFYIIDVPDLDEALKSAARSPAAAHGAVEIRPVVMRASVTQRARSSRRAAVLWPACRIAGLAPRQPRLDRRSLGRCADPSVGPLAQDRHARQPGGLVTQDGAEQGGRRCTIARTRAHL